MFFILRSNQANPYEMHTEADGSKRIVLSQQTTYLQRGPIEEALESIQSGELIIIDASKTKFIDADIQEMIDEFVTIKAPLREIKVKTIA